MSWPVTTRDERWTRTGVRAWTIIGVLIVVAAAAWALSQVTSALLPFGIGLLVVLLLRRPVEWLSRWMRRSLAVLVCYLTVLVVLAIALVFLVPPIYAQVAQFIGAVPGYVAQAYKLWNEYVAHPTAGRGVPTWVQSAVVALKDQVVAGAGTWSTAIAGWAVSAGSSIASGLVAFVLAFIVGFYTLADLPRLEKEIQILAGEKWEEEISHALRTITRVIGGWLRGVLIQSSIVATLYTIGLWIAHVPYALALGVIGGLINVVPYVGPAVTLALVVGAGLFVSPATAIWGVVAVLIVMQIDGLVMSPRIMSAQLDLHPLLVIFSLLVGATLFGVPGMVLAVPVAAVIKGIFVYWFERRSERQIFTSDGVLLRASRQDVSEAQADATEAVAPGETGGGPAEPRDEGE